MFPQFFNQEAETMSPEKIEEIKLEKLKTQLAYVYQNSPF